jgi:hypothetical protein
VELPSDYRSYVQSLSGNTRSMLQRRTKQVMAEPDTRLVECASEEDLPEFLDALFALNDRRWRANGQIGTFVRKPGEARFYRTFAGPALRAGWLRIFGLDVQGRLSAVQVGYVYGDAFLQMQEGFDPEGPTGIGNVLRGKVSSAASRTGCGTTTSSRVHRAQAALARGAPRRARPADREPDARGMLLRIAKPWPSGRYLRPDPLPGA